jgi:hypothetical protein
MPDAGTFGGCRDPWNLAYLDTVVLKNYDHFWNSPELQDQYVELVDFVFSIAENLPNVIGVDVMNEPFPDMSGKFERVKLTRLYERIKAMIEDKGYTKLMFFEPWMSTSAGPSTCLKFGAGEGTVYFPHYYDVFVDANKPYGPANKKLMEEVIQAKVYEAEQFGCPIMFGEFGARPAGPGALEYISDLLDLFDKYRIGWTYYSYDLPQYCGYSFIDQDKNPNAMHEVLFGRVYPQRIAGDDPTYGIVGNQFNLTYKKIETQQPTVIFVPENKQVTVETAGQYTISGQWILYKNTDEETQSVTVRW